MKATKHFIRVWSWIFLGISLGVFFSFSLPALAQDGGGDKGLFEFGALGSLMLPSGVEGTDEVYPSFGPHIAMRTDFAVIEAQGVLGFQESALAATSGVSVTNTILFVPVALRFDFNNSKSMPGYATAGGHIIYYNSHDAAGGAIHGANGGFNFGGGLIFDMKQVDFRTDLRILLNPGATVLLSFIAFLNF